LAALAAACGRGARTEKTPPPPVQAATRVVCGSPAVTEIVFALGCGARVVGVSDFADYPPEAAAKPRIGGWFNPNRERLLVLKPDLIVSQGKHESLMQFAQSYGVRFESVRLDTLADLYAAIQTVAEALGEPDEGRKLGRATRAAMERVQERVRRLPPRRVLVVLGRTPGDLSGLTSIGPGSVLQDLLTAAGGTNVFADATGAYPQVSKETLLVRKPEVVLEVRPGSLPDATRRMLREDWDRIPGIPAVEAGRIHYLTNEYLLIPGPRVAETVARLGEAIHPEAFQP
jgi:iron complex transport system substrate-binding protein